tara:strand:+ start:3604 stop:4278 length:675 start_codon:yes stop_codon:yes gene_type:complete
MAEYFRHFPKTFYTLDDDSPGLDSVTNILARFSIEPNLLENTNLFYPYDVQDTDTPEIIASKIYGGVERHWIVLSFNKIVDPQWDWPLNENNFIKYVNDKYTANADTANGETGIAYALSESNIHAYFKVVTRTITAGASNRESRSRSQTIEKLEVDANTFATIGASTTVFTLKDGNQVTEEISKSTESHYTYEFNENEAKRKIKLLKPDFVLELDKEFKGVFLR